MQQLLPYEEQFAGTQSDVGYVEAFPFKIDVTDLSTPIREKPIAYDSDARAWLKDYMAELCAKGVVRKLQVGESDPLFLSNIVLVRGQQSGQDYRACANLVAVNARTRPPAYPIPDCRQVVDATARSRFFYPIDLKAGFHNIPIFPPHRTYAGIIT